LAAKLDAYLSVQPADFASAQGVETAGAAGGSMARGKMSPAALRQVPAIPHLPQEQRAALAAADLGLELPGENLAVFVSAGTSLTFPLTVKRDEVGWFVGPAQPGEDPAVPASELLREREDLTEMLSLPVGFSVIMDEAGVVEVRNPQQQTVWNRGN
jgi:hypothetical protein